MEEAEVRGGGGKEERKERKEEKGEIEEHKPENK